MIHIETLFLTLSTLIIISILIARLSNNIGVPVLLLFLGIGMLAGSEGPGGIYFDDPKIAQTIGVIALIFILFSGGLDTQWKIVKPVLWPALSLSTLGVLITTLSVALFTTWLFKFPLLPSLLLGAIVASTDAAAVFSIIGARNLKLKGNITPLLELESGSNDPMAVFLTISLIEIIQAENTSYLGLAGNFLQEMGIGLLLGIGLGKGMVIVINRLKFPIEGLYAVFALAGAFFVYSLTTMLHGSGFLAVYLAGLVVGNHNIVHKKNLFRFFDGMAWVSQVIMFLSLGLLVFPSQILPAFKAEILISLFLIFFARPLGVFISLLPFKFPFKEKVFISWVGLRGAVPIILATFPMIEGIKEAQWIFNVVFFIVLTSALFQGWSIPLVAKLLKLDVPNVELISSPTEFSYLDQTDRTLIKLTVPDSNLFINKTIVQITALKGSLIVSVKRGDKYFVPSGGTILEAGDELQALVEHEKLNELKLVLELDKDKNFTTENVL
jgi:cell volume regulation protein A